LITTFALLLPDLITPVSDYIYQIFNALAGRSWLLDNLIALPLDNEMVKAAVIGACFLAVWFGGRSVADTHRARKILLVTLVAVPLVIVTTKTLSKTVFLPRPFIQSQKLFYLENDRLIEARRLPYRVPLDKENQDSYHNLLTGEVQGNDLGSFPSDHAGFYLTVAAGIWFASRPVGMIALAWSLLVILLGRVITGMHSPLDIVAGAGIGLVILAACQSATRSRWLSYRFDRIASWTLQHTALSSALIFITMYEVSSTLTHVRPLLKTGVAMLKHLSGRGI
jgi:undecaprenyl-diphosphatase